MIMLERAELEEGQKQFQLGAVEIMPAVEEHFSPIQVLIALARHSVMDWGDVPGWLWEHNQIALEAGNVVWGRYLCPGKPPLYIGTIVGQITVVTAPVPTKG